MVKFTCLTCWKTKNDTELKWWKDTQVCARCFNKYQRLSKKNLEVNN